MNSEVQMVKEEEKTAVSLRTGGFRRGKRKGDSFRSHLLTILGKGRWLLELKAWISKSGPSGKPERARRARRRASWHHQHSVPTLVLIL